MNATELFLKDGRTAGIFFCERCRCVAPTEHLAGQCCQNYQCQTCGQDTGTRHYTVCEPCRRKEEAAKEAERYAKAEKLTQWDGWVFAEGFGDEYFSDTETLLDHCDGEDVTPPPYAWACSENHFVCADVSDITDRMDDDAYEDFDSNSLLGLPELRLALERFNEENKDAVAFSPDYSKAIVLPPRTAG